MRCRSALLVIFLIPVLATCWYFGAPLLQAQSFPTSVGLLYFPQKNYEVSDWVLYEIRDSDLHGNETLVFQQIQVAMAVRYRGEDCIWLETGLGAEPEGLTFSAVLLSERLYEDEMPEVRHTYYVRKMHVGEDPHGVPVSMEMRVGVTGDTLKDLSHRRPVVEFAGMDTLTVGETSYVCSLRIETQEFASIRDFPDSTVRTTTTVVRRRWVTPEVPITGLVRERERREIHRQSWALGKDGTNSPPRLRELYEIEIDLAGHGTGAEPRIADRIKDTLNPFQTE
jgi:hypothetical protein